MSHVKKGCIGLRYQVIDMLTHLLQFPSHWQQLQHLMSTSRPTKSSAPSPAVSNGRRSPTPSTTPTHTKPKATPSTTVSSKPTTKSTQASPSPTTAKRQLPAKKPAEKSASPSVRPPQRTQSTPASTRERSPKPPSRIPAATKPKVNGSDKGSKPIKSVATGLYSRSKSLEKRREVVSPSVDHTTSPLDRESPITKTDIEEKEEQESPVLRVEDITKNDIESPVGVEEPSHDDHETSHHPQQLIDEHLEEEPVVNEEVEEEEEKEETITQIDEGPKEPVSVKIEPAQEVAPENPAVMVTAVKEAPERTVVVGTRRGESAQKNNDVIEEAKSKFLEKRKNKVLALVGAFETVMALQEPEGQQSQPPQRKGKESEEGSGASATTAGAAEEINDTVAESTEST